MKPLRKRGAIEIHELRKFDLRNSSAGQVALLFASAWSLNTFPVGPNSRSSTLTADLLHDAAALFEPAFDRSNVPPIMNCSWRSDCRQSISIEHSEDLQQSQHHVVEAARAVQVWNREGHQADCASRGLHLGDRSSDTRRYVQSSSEL